MNHVPAPIDTLPLLCDRERLIRRWQHGSDAFFWRHERRGTLLAVSDGTKVRYRRSDVYDFEGGQPPDGMADHYAGDLVTEVQAAHVCSVKPAYILRAAREGDLPCRRVGSAYRFVPVELMAWQEQRFVNRKTLKTSLKSPDE